MSQPVPELSRLVSVDRVGTGGVTIDMIADEAERLAVAERLGIPSISSLRCKFDLVRSAGETAVVLATGELSATMVQICVVTLEPFEAPLAERFRLRFVPAGREVFDEDPDSEDEIGYEGASIDVGEAAVEQLALALDPFPRRPDARLPDLRDEVAEGPFAALAARRGRQE